MAMILKPIYLIACVDIRLYVRG